ncbi:MAG: ATP-dependent helicase/nuclease subunit A [Hyphomicrobiaceae bacterium hypho_1]
MKQVQIEDYDKAKIHTERLIRQTETLQAQASSPEISAWVSANAGAGKTHVLKLRVLRLLLAGTPPERILCLTYTKAASAEMSQRIFCDLSEWTISSNDTLIEKLAKLLGRYPTDEELTLSRQLFARAIETPGGLKIQTIHAFCERLLQRFPLEANVTPGFTILDSDLATVFKHEAITATLREASAAPNSKLNLALQVIVAHASDESFDQILTTVLQRRQWLEDMGGCGYDKGNDQNFERVDQFYRRIFNVSDSITLSDLIQQQADVLSSSDLHNIAGTMHGGSKQDCELGDLLLLAAETHGERRIDYLRKVFLTKDGKPRSDKKFISKKLRNTKIYITSQLRQARDTFYTLTQEGLGLETINATLALLRVGSHILRYYENAKFRRAVLDFEDLITKSASLLAANDAADWVLYKLDGGIDHILVDEAQDTSPMQWNIIEALTAEFFSGKGTNDTTRSIFAVGDEKQSIYSFQGAAPEQFALVGKRFEKKVKGIEQDWANVPLTLSFRTVKPILDAVDVIFSDMVHTPGINISGGVVSHQALRILDSGSFEIWPIIKLESQNIAPPFSPMEDITPDAPADILARKIAKRIKSWLESSEMLQSQGRPIRAGDIIILLRRRKPFGPKIVRALKNLGIPVAGSDRIVLSEQIVIQDLLALADFLLLPEDDLALACALKSPLFNFDDDDLLLFAANRRSSLWSALLTYVNNLETHHERFSYATERLKRWQYYVNSIPPYEFFSMILDHDGGRAQLIGRLGPDAADPLDEFMNLALTYDQRAPASLQGFIYWVRDGVREIKRDMEQARNEVRVMTVHSAKGLEAPIVFLPDTCTAPGGGLQKPLVDLLNIEIPEKKSVPQAWAIKGVRALKPIANELEKVTRREIEEHTRLLYVALTRARDRVYVAGYENKARRPKTCWYDTIWNRLEGKLCMKDSTDGEKIWVIESTQKQKASFVSPSLTLETNTSPLPSWALRKVPYESQSTISFAPSRLVHDEVDEDKGLSKITTNKFYDVQLVKPPLIPELLNKSEKKFLKGNLIHALLESLPVYEKANHRALAEEYLRVRGESLGKQTCALIIEEVLRVISDPLCSAAFQPEAKAEVPIVAELISSYPNVPPLRVSGKIDRLVQTSDGILIVDFKSNRNPPQMIDDVPTSYLMQVAAYRLALRNIFPSVSVHAAFIWTFGPSVMRMPCSILDDKERCLWSLHNQSLDAC